MQARICFALNAPKLWGFWGLWGPLEGLLCIGACVAASYLKRRCPGPLPTTVGTLLSTQYYRGISCDLIAQHSAVVLVLACSVAACRVRSGRKRKSKLRGPSKEEVDIWRDPSLKQLTLTPWIWRYRLVVDAV